MKTIRITVILFSIMTVFACNNQQRKNTENIASSISNLPIEKSIDKKAVTTEGKESKSCELMVTEILTTSPRYRQLTKGLYQAVVKNGGSSFGINLEGSPNPGQDKAKSYSKTYDFTLYEMYPDRKLNTAHFSFDPNKKQLYEYDAVLDQLKPIEFDRNLLLKYKALCK